MPTQQETGRIALGRELRWLALSGSAVLLLCGAILAVDSDGRAVLQWAGQAGLLWGMICSMARSRLGLNRADDRSLLYSGLGWGNRVTLGRGLLIAITGGFLFSAPGSVGPPVLPALSYGLAALLDRADGFIARRFGQTTLLGSELDIRLDALGLVIAPLLAIQWGRLNGSYLLLSVAFYAYRWALQRRRNRQLPVLPLPENSLRRILAGFQMGFVTLALWPETDPAFGRMAGIAFMAPLLFGFAVDWGIATGRIDPTIIDVLEQWREGYLMPALRLLLFGLGCAWLDQSGQTPALASTAAWLSGLLMVLLGLSGRVGALLLLLHLDGEMARASDGMAATALVIGASWLLMLGTGRYSLLPWGEDWLRRYDGARGTAPASTESNHATRSHL
jgi:phosphatidylglycerophosphate synthase